MSFSEAFAALSASLTAGAQRLSGASSSSADAPAAVAAAAAAAGAEARKLSLSDFDVCEQLGEGAFGTVCRCLRRSSGVAYALKAVSIAHATRNGGLAQVIAERDALVALEDPGHPNVIRLHATFRDDDSLYLVLELATGGELFSHIRRLGACSLPCARWLTAELVNALEYLHGHGVVHRDLKPENLLLDEVGHLKLVDFGSCCRERLPTAAAAGDGVDGEAASGDAGRPADTRRFVGTAEYVSPEVLGDGDATAASDLWALGAIAYQMLAGDSALWRSRGGVAGGP